MAIENILGGNELTIIEQREVLGKDFKIYGDFEKPLFLAKDVAEWIEHSNSTEMIRAVDDDEKLNSTILSAGQNREMTFLTEDGLYEVLMQSRKPIAKEFKREVKAILKSIRKHGGYLTPQKIEEVLLNPDTIIRLATDLKEERSKRMLAEKIVKEQKPIVDYCNKILQSKESIPVTVIASDYGYSAVAFNRLLKFYDIQRKVKGTWVLYKKYEGNGYTDKVSFIYDTEKNKSSTHTYWTQKGRMFLYDFLKEKNILPIIEKQDKAG